MLIVFLIGLCANGASAADSTDKKVVKPSKVSQSQVLSSSKYLKTYIEKNKKLPNYITIGNYKYSMEEYMSISSTTIYYKNKKLKKDVVVKYGIKSPKSPTGSTIKGKLTKTQYYKYSSNVVKYINKYNTAPNYVSTKLGKVQFQSFIYGNSKILAWSKDNKGALPKTLTLSIAKTNSMNKYLPKFSGNTVGTSNNTNNSQITLSKVQILKISKQIRNYVDENNSLPSYVLINDKQYSMSEFLYLLSSAIVNVNKGNNGNITPISVKSPSYPDGNFTSGVLQKSEFVTLATNVLNFINTNKQAPNYANSRLGNIKFQFLVYEFSKVLDFADSNGSLPNNLTINTTNHPLIVSGNSNLNDTYGPTGDGFIIITSSNYSCGPLLVKYNDKYLISTGKCSCGDAGNYSYHNSTFKNYCPFCKKEGCMIYEEGPTCKEGMWVCSICDADFCLVTGKEHIAGTNKYLTKTEYIPTPPTNTNNQTNNQTDNQTDNNNNTNNTNISNNTNESNSSVINNSSNLSSNNSIFISDENNSINKISYNSIETNNSSDINNIEFENLNNINQLVPKEEDMILV